jgi:hypothetical protein
LRFIAFTPLATEGVCTPRDEAFGYILAGLFFVEFPQVRYETIHAAGFRQ